MKVHSDWTRQRLYGALVLEHMLINRLKGSFTEDYLHGVERGATSDAFLGGGKNERCGNFKVSILSLINFSF